MRKSGEIFQNGWCINHDVYWCHDCMEEIREAEALEWIAKQQAIRDLYAAWHRYHDPRRVITEN